MTQPAGSSKSYTMVVNDGVFWCSCCTVAQMARHTADYETYAARCCSDTGLPPNVQLTDETATVPLAGSVV